MKKIIPIVLIVLGVLFLLTPFITDQLVAYYSKSIVSEDMSNEILIENNKTINESIENDNIENEKPNIEYDFTAVEDVDIISVIRGSQNLDKELVIGILYIPDLDLNLPIMKGLTDANLMAGAATMKPEQSFGQGNYTLSGHNMKRKDLLFGSLMDIEVGSKAYVSNGETIYEYDIYGTEIVPDTAMHMLSDEKSEEKGQAILSLMTCYISSKTGKRFFALGQLVDEYPAD